MSKAGETVLRQRVGIEPHQGWWRVVVKAGGGVVRHPVLYTTPDAAQGAAEAEAHRLRRLWRRLDISVVVTTYAHESLRAA